MRQTKKAIFLILTLLLCTSAFALFDRPLYLFKQTINSSNLSDLNNYYNKTYTSDTFVPYTGASSNVNLGTNDLTATDLIATNQLLVGESNTPLYTYKGSLTIQDMFLGLGAGKTTDRSGSGRNIGIGEDSVKSLTTGFEDVGIGYRTLESVTTGYRNVAIGAYAAYHLTTGMSNMAVGRMALGAIQTGNNNLAIGADALQYPVSSSSNNIGLGSSAIKGISGNVVSNNIGIGSYSLANVETGANYNLAIGSQAGYSVSTGRRNLLLGYRTGRLITTGSNNILMGYYIEPDSITGDDQLNIGNLITGNMATGSEQLNINGKLNTGVNDIQTTGSIKGIHKTSDGTSAVADGEYVMGIGNDTNGSITIKDGLITSITEAS